MKARQARETHLQRQSDLAGNRARISTMSSSGTGRTAAAARRLPSSISTEEVQQNLRFMRRRLVTIGTRMDSLRLFIAGIWGALRVDCLLTSCADPNQPSPEKMTDGRGGEPATERARAVRRVRVSGVH